MSRRKQFAWMLVAAAVLAASGCASRDRWIDCESLLEPINAPAPLERDDGTRRAGKAQAPASEPER